MKKILFIGNIQCGEPPTGGGVQAKNQEILAYLKNRKDICLSYIDTWKKSAMSSSISAVTAIINSSNDTDVYFSISNRGVIAIISLIILFGIKRNMYLFVSGGSVDKNLSRREVQYFRHLKCIYVQGKFLKDYYLSNGLDNVEILHNFKSVKYRPIMNVRKKNNLKCVFLGRVFPEKGIDTIIEAFSNLKNESIDIDIYGSLLGYSEKFLRKLPNIAYRGFLNLKNKSGYDVLADYDVMVFPTRFEGEGFPGVILDAFIAGLPVIATDFHVNPEIVINNQNGLIIPVSDPDALVKSLQLLNSDRTFLNRLKQGAYLSADIYTPDKALNKVFK